jgi:hopanoid biosynthesis associated RND transporter like protein HpnN
VRIKRLTEDSLVARALGVLARGVVQYRRWFVYPQVVLFVLAILYTIWGFPPLGLKGLQFDTSRSNLVGKDKKYHQNFLRFKREFPTQDDLAVVVESDDPARNRQFVERLGAKLEAEPQHFHNIFYKGDMKMMGSKALLFAQESDLTNLNKTLTDYRPFIQQFSHTTNLVSLFNMVNTRFRTAKREKNEETDSLLQALPALEGIVTEASGSLHRTGTPPSPGVMAFFSTDEDAEQQIYITFAKGRIYLVTAQAPTEEQNEETVLRMRQLMAETQAEVPGLSVGLTGEPVLEHDEMAQSQKDTMIASIASLVICALIFIYGYQETGRPVKATLCLLVGLAYTLAFATFAVGHLNILTITFVPILIGLAIDYGVHLISRYEEELRHGKSEEAAITKAIVYTGQGIFTGAFTTAGAFLAMAFTDFKGIQEMGIICGGGLLICLVPMLTMLPVLLLRGRQNVIDHVVGEAVDRRARIENLWLQRPVLVTCVTAVLCALAFTQLRRVYFDYDLLNMQSAGLPAVVFEKKLIRSADKSVLFGAVIADNQRQAAELEARLKKLSSVSSVDSIARFNLDQDQTRKLQIVGEIKQSLASISFPDPDPRPVDLIELSRSLYSLYGFCEAAQAQAEKEDPKLGAQLHSLHEAIGDLRNDLSPEKDAQLQKVSLKLGEFQQALFNDIQDTFQALQNQDDKSPLCAQDLPQAIRDRFVGVTGKYLLMVYPKKDVWQRDNQKEFIDQIATVDQEVTGTPVQLYHYTDQLRRSYENAARYALIAITLLVFFHFRSPLCVALALIPVGVGFLWLGGLMGWLGVPLNPANIMTLPLVIGIGVTNGIHILNRFAEEQNPSILARSTGKAVLVSGLTAMAGFGSLMLARHQGIQSLGKVMTTGLATCMIAGLTFLPALLNLLILQRPKENTAEKEERPSADNARSTLGREEPRSKTSSLTID